jgi:alcohol dehydrogenase
VQVCAAGLNPLDFKLRQGPIADFLVPKPKILGQDISGRVINAPKGSCFQPGDKVFAMLPLLGTIYGGYASKCCVDEALLAKAPANVNLVELSCLPLALCTIVQALRPVVSAYKQQTAGKRCFVTAGTGGIGSLAVQYCSKVLGMEVTASCSSANSAFVKSLGAVNTLDYHTERIEEHVRDMDVVFDTLGYQHEEVVLAKGSSVLKPRDAHYIRIASSPYRSSTLTMSADPFGLAVPEARLDRLLTGYWKQLTSYALTGTHYHFILVHPEAAALNEVAPYLQSGVIVPIVQQRFPLGQAAQAHLLLEQGHVRGKLVLEVDPSLA